MSITITKNTPKAIKPGCMNDPRPKPIHDQHLSFKRQDCSATHLLQNKLLEVAKNFWINVYSRSSGHICVLDNNAKCSNLFFIWYGITRFSCGIIFRIMQLNVHNVSW